MLKRLGAYTVKFENEPTICGYGSVAGKKEAMGPLKKYFGKIVYDSYDGRDTYEQAESGLQSEALLLALEKARLNAEDVDCVFAGDLLNQCIASGFGLKKYGIPYLGQYGACSTMAQSLILAAASVESGGARTAACVTSSHFASAERQYRFPLEYGGVRTPTAQWTVTGAGCCILSKCVGGVRVSAATVGRINDLGVTDPNNMGAAMAPAAAQTLESFLQDTQTHPDDFDLILTGDLGEVGSKLLYELLENDGINIRSRHNDCGLMIFERSAQDVHAGGSGCGCSASVLCSKIMSDFENGLLSNALFIATGALMSPTSSGQGASIPSIAHLVNLVKS